MWIISPITFSFYYFECFAYIKIQFQYNGTFILICSMISYSSSCLRLANRQLWKIQWSCYSLCTFSAAASVFSYSHHSFLLVPWISKHFQGSTPNMSLFINFFPIWISSLSFVLWHLPVHLPKFCLTDLFSCDLFSCYLSLLRNITVGFQ